VANAFAVLCDPGDEVLVPARTGRRIPSDRPGRRVPVIVDTDESTGFKATVADLEAKRTERTKVLLFVSPSNPTGAVYSHDEIEAIGHWRPATACGCSPTRSTSISSTARRELLPACGVPSSPTVPRRQRGGKTYAMTGWRVGWLLGPTDMIAAATNIQSHETSNVANVSQRAAIAALTGDLSAVTRMREAFDRRRRTIVKLLNEIDGVTCIEPEGAFYAFPS